MLGYRVRVGRFATKDAADAENARLAAAGETATSVYTGWDGDRSAPRSLARQRGADRPAPFTGRLAASFGPDLHDRETTSALSQAAGATPAVNAGYFVLDPASGAPGDPAGAGVYGGRLLSETMGDRPTLVLHDDAEGTGVRRFTWRGTARVAGRTATSTASTGSPA